MASSSTTFKFLGTKAEEQEQFVPTVIRKITQDELNGGYLLLTPEEAMSLVLQRCHGGQQLENGKRTTLFKIHDVATRGEHNRALGRNAALGYHVDLLKALFTQMGVKRGNKIGLMWSPASTSLKVAKIE